MITEDEDLPPLPEPEVYESSLPAGWNEQQVRQIQREAIEAAGRFIPLIVENVRGAQKWVGRSRWNYGSFHLWGDVPALMPMTTKRGMKGSVGTVNGSGKRREQSSGDRGEKVSGFRFDGSGKSFQSAAVDGCKGIPHRPTGHWTNPAEHGTKQPGLSGLRNNGKGDGWFQDGAARHGSKSSARKAAVCNMNELIIIQTLLNLATQSAELAAVLNKARSEGRDVTDAEIDALGVKDDDMRARLDAAIKAKQG